MNLIIATMMSLLWLQAPVSPRESVADATATRAQERRSLADLAATADLIAVIQVEDTTYEYRRRIFPVKGTGYVKVLLPYKGDVEAGTLIQIPEQGLDDSACYYPRLDLFQVEGARFLAFLEHVKDDVYAGVAPYCRLPVFVTDNAQYALKFPIAGVAFEDDERVRQLHFADPAAYVDTAEMTSMQIAALEAEFARPVPAAPGFPQDTRYVYTRGIMLSDVRSDMFLPGHTASRR